MYIYQRNSSYSLIINVWFAFRFRSRPWEDLSGTPSSEQQTGKLIAVCIRNNAIYSRIHHMQLVQLNSYLPSSLKSSILDASKSSNGSSLSAVNLTYTLENTMDSRGNELEGNHELGLVFRFLQWRHPRQKTFLQVPSNNCVRKPLYVWWDAQLIPLKRLWRGTDTRSRRSSVQTTQFQRFSNKFCTVQRSNGADNQYTGAKESDSQFSRG